MHIRAISKQTPAPASQIVFILDAISQVLSILSQITVIIDWTRGFIGDIGDIFNKQA